MKGALDSLDRITILWDFIWSSFRYIPLGLILGFWWAGERKRFRSSH